MPEESETTEVTWAKVLKAIAEDSPWFASQYAQNANINRNELNEPVNGLRSAGLIQVSDWVKGKGQAYTLTAEGREALKLPTLPIPSTAPAPKPKAEDTGTTTFERGEQARHALYLPRRAIVTPLFIAAIIIWFLVGVGMSASHSLGSYLRGTDNITVNKLGAVSGLALLHGEWWRLVTSMFVHIGLVHFAMNLMGLASVGSLVESLWGRVRFAVIVLASGAAGAAVAMMFRPDAMLAGASGAIWGLLLSVPAWLFSYGMHLPPEHVRDISRRLGLGLIINAGISFAPGISFEAHFAGGAIGFLTAIILDTIRPGNKWKALPAAGVLILLPLFFAMVMKRCMERAPSWASLRYYEEAQRMKPVLGEVKVAVPTFASASRWHQEIITASAFNLKNKLALMKPAFTQYEQEVKKFQSATETMGMKAEVQAYANELVTLLDTLNVVLGENAKAADRAKATLQLKTLRTAWEKLGIAE